MELNVRVDMVLPHPIERVWHALTDPDALRSWLMEHDGFAAVVGTRFSLHGPANPEWRGRVDCVVLEVDPPHRMVWSWHTTDEGEPTRVVIELSPVAEGTRLTLRHTGDTTPGQAALTAPGWRSELQELQTWLAAFRSGPERPSPEGATMTHLLVRIRVADFDAWKRVFDSHADAQRAAGLRVVHVLRNLDDPREVIQWFDVTDLEKAKGFVYSPDVPDARRQAGVLNEPEITFLA